MAGSAPPPHEVTVYVPETEADVRALIDDLSISAPRHRQMLYWLQQYIPRLELFSADPAKQVAWTTAVLTMLFEKVISLSRTRAERVEIEKYAYGLFCLLALKPNPMVGAYTLTQRQTSWAANKLQVARSVDDLKALLIHLIDTSKSDVFKHMVANATDVYDVSGSRIFFASSSSSLSPQKLNFNAYIQYAVACSLFTFGAGLQAACQRGLMPMQLQSQMMEDYDVAHGKSPNASHRDYFLPRVFTWVGTPDYKDDHVDITTLEDFSSDLSDNFVNDMQKIRSTVQTIEKNIVKIGNISSAMSSSSGGGGSGAAVASSSSSSSASALADEEDMDVIFARVGAARKQNFKTVFLQLLDTLANVDPPCTKTRGAHSLISDQFEKQRSRLVSKWYKTMKTFALAIVDFCSDLTIELQCYKAYAQGKDFLEEKAEDGTMTSSPIEEVLSLLDCLLYEEGILELAGRIQKELGEIPVPLDERVNSLYYGLDELRLSPDRKATVQANPGLVVQFEEFVKLMVILAKTNRCAIELYQWDKDADFRQFLVSTERADEVTFASVQESLMRMIKTRSGILHSSARTMIMLQNESVGEFQRALIEALDISSFIQDGEDEYGLYLSEDEERPPVQIDDIKFFLVQKNAAKQTRTMGHFTDKQDVFF